MMLIKTPETKAPGVKGVLVFDQNAHWIFTKP